MNCLAFKRGPGGLLDQLQDLPDLAEVVFTIALNTIELPPPSDRDEGPIHGMEGLYWRRLLSRADSRSIDEGTFVPDDDDRAPWNYILVYRAATPDEAEDAGCGEGAIFVELVVYAGDLAFVEPLFD